MSSTTFTQKIELALARACFEDRRYSAASCAEGLAEVRERRKRHRADLDRLEHTADALEAEMRHETRTGEVLLDLLPLRRDAEDVASDQGRNALQVREAELALQAERVKESELFEVLRTAEQRAARERRVVSSILEDKRRTIQITHL